MFGEKKSLFPRAVTLGLVLSATALLAGCKSQTPESNLSMLAANDYQLRHPIVVEEGYENLDLPVGSNARILSTQMADRISQFGAQSRTGSGGSVEVLVPSGAANEAAVHALVPQIRKALVRGGVRSSKVAVRSFAVTDPSANAPIRLAYRKMMAKVDECGRWPSNLAGGFNKNVDYENYGCATQANLAAMVENPADLIAPRAMTPADQARRGTVYEKYRAGEVTAADSKEGVGAQVSE
ncbi:MAG: CpaD family pilus assembly protein [Rhodobacteraceae bacterium]|nr:CpaD family pilus assembly protein [Paracoccaceae bacterium]